MRISYWSSDVCSSDLDRGMIVEGQPDGADRARPRPACDVGDRIFLGQIVGLAQPSVEDVEQTQRFAPIAVDRIGLPLGCIADEMMRLSLHRAEARQDRRSTRLNSSH